MLCCDADGEGEADLDLSEYHRSLFGFREDLRRIGPVPSPIVVVSDGDDTLAKFGLFPR